MTQVKTLIEIAIASLLSGILSVLVAAWVLKGLPADYFSVGDKTRTGHWLLHNALGWFLILAGIVLSIPGVPGQGLLTILAGVILADFPRKMQLERWLMRRPAIFRGANSLRRRFNQPPFSPPEY